MKSNFYSLDESILSSDALISAFDSSIVFSSMSSTSSSYNPSAKNFSLGSCSSQ
jgi:hypothetical protein